jgi:signal transduction histidine kinase
LVWLWPARAERLPVKTYTVADGLPAGYSYVSYRDRHNNLWFGTERDVARFVPEPPRHRTPPTILITGLRVNGDPQSVSMLGERSVPTLALSSDQRQITVDFIGVGANLGEKLKYEYRLADTDWTPTTERTLNFANLAAGDYQFAVRAQTADRIYSQPATAAFSIAAPVWRRWWFLALTALAVGGVVYLIYRYRVQRLLELEKLRTRIATDLHDDIGANLTRISLLSEVAKQKAENGNEPLLTSIADIARESVSSMNDIVWAVAPEHDSLLDLTRRMRQHAEEVFALRNIELEFHAPDVAMDTRLSVGARRDLLLIFKEAVNNAAKHSACTRLRIDFGFADATLKLRIADNGQGFDPAESYDGQGLRSMSRRAVALGGRLTVESASGTSIEFSLPLAKVVSV